MEESIKTVDKWGNQRWKNKNGKCHRDGDLPAVVYQDGERWWFKNNTFHRIHGPASIWSNGYETWSIDLMVPYEF